MRVTFDSHVWENVVIPENHKKDPDHALLVKINTGLQGGRLEGFICESIGTLEAIKKDTRPEYFANRIPKTHVETVTGGNHTHIDIKIKIDHDRHPGLDGRLVQKLQLAQDLGMRLLYIPAINIQLPKQFLNNQAFYESRLFETQSYADRFWEVARAIEGRGIGAAAITKILKVLKERLQVSATDSRWGMQLLQHAQNDAERMQISKAIGEWADGDLVASHIASGNDLLCTEDRGKSADGPSVFDNENRLWLRANYNVHIVSIRELASHISN